ncbi:hypothetical protein BSF44_55900 [Pseudomonas sp. ACN8]|uniref:Uncharacterized protein n=1 Tax=Pseudomonas fluorescens TaxID=294 RepID=A0A5E7U8M7_PSEFL|nr:hypothetical protein BSF44_55900 [Pseudomonas sp. ACN8]VVQ06466.1 hypothetical protein PS938_03038 [Pseudomonas fluorescens]
MTMGVALAGAKRNAFMLSVGNEFYKYARSDS